MASSRNTDVGAFASSGARTSVSDHRPAPVSQIRSGKVEPLQATCAVTGTPAAPTLCETTSSLAEYGVSRRTVGSTPTVLAESMRSAACATSSSTRSSTGLSAPMTSTWRGGCASLPSGKSTSLLGYSWTAML